MKVLEPALPTKETLIATVEKTLETPVVDAANETTPDAASPVDPRK